MDGAYDEALSRLHRTGPEFRAWLSNHGPMAVDALVRLGGGAGVHRWVDEYLERLEECPRPRWPIAPEDWRDPLGDPSRLGDWLAFFADRLAEQPWRTVLATWWPRLLPGAVASATHGLIRTGHAVRALAEEPTAPRLTELGQALGYWAARWAPLPDTARAQPGGLPPAAALAALPTLGVDGGVRTRLAALAEAPGPWAAVVVAAASPATAAEVPAALEHLVDAAVGAYARWAGAQPVMLVHLATAPRAASLVLPELPPALWVDTYWHAWKATAAVGSAYRGGTPLPPAPRVTATDEELRARAAAHGDAHVVKLTETALGRPAGSQAAAAAIDLIG